jgi:hypothetical protein
MKVQKCRKPMHRNLLIDFSIQSVIFSVNTRDFSTHIIKLQIGVRYLRKEEAIGESKQQCWRTSLSILPFNEV